MTSKYKYHSNKEVRQLINWAQEHGWHVERITGKSHVLMRHENGATVTFASSPGAWRSLRNAKADMIREAKRGR